MLSGPRIEPLGGMGKSVRDDKAYFVICLAAPAPHRGGRLVVRKNLIPGFHAWGFHIRCSRRPKQQVRAYRNAARSRAGRPQSTPPSASVRRHLDLLLRVDQVGIVDGFAVVL